MMVKSAQPDEGGGAMHAHPLSLYLPSLKMLLCILQLRGQIHSHYFSSTHMYSVDRAVGGGGGRVARVGNVNGGGGGGYGYWIGNENAEDRNEEGKGIITRIFGNNHKFQAMFRETNETLAF